MGDSDDLGRRWQLRLSLSHRQLQRHARHIEEAFWAGDGKLLVSMPLRLLVAGRNQEDAFLPKLHAAASA